MNNPYNYLFKYIIVGDTNVGKSCLLLQYVDKKFRQAHETTIGVEFGAKVMQLNDKFLKIQVWDTAGQESFRSITRSYYRGSIGALLVYDVTRRESYENLHKWVEEVKQWGQEKLQIALVGNKIDLDSQRQVTTDEGKEFALQNNMAFFETSAKQDINVEEAFIEVANRICGLIDYNLIDLKNENCGIKVGSRFPENQTNDEDIIKQKNGCC